MPMFHLTPERPQWVAEIDTLFADRLPMTAIEFKQRRKQSIWSTGTAYTYFLQKGVKLPTVPHVVVRLGTSEIDARYCYVHELAHVVADKHMRHYHDQTYWSVCFAMCLQAELPMDYVAWRAWRYIKSSWWVAAPFGVTWDDVMRHQAHCRPPDMRRR